MKRHDFSFDIETLGSKPYSIIAAIGCVTFDRRTGEIFETFYKEISVEDCKKYKLKSDPNVEAWWKKQPKDLQECLKGTAELKFTLKDLFNFIIEKSHNDSVMWGNGSGFDINLLENAYWACDANPPWNYWQANDMRTIVTLGKDIGISLKRDIPRDSAKHNALDDAIYQAKVISTITKELIRARQT